MTIIYAGGIKKNNKQVCAHCGFSTQDVKEFHLENDFLSKTLVVSEECLTCYFKIHKEEIDEAMFNAPDEDF